MEQEIWKFIEGLEGYYQISNFGNVRSIDRIIERKNTHPNFRKGYILNKSINRGGYVYIRTWVNNKKKMVFPQREVAKHFIPNPENKPEVNHIDGDKLNNNWKNLEWATRDENMAHATKNGLHNLNGENHTSSKLKNEEVINMRRMYSEGVITMVWLAKKYNVSNQTVGGIIHRKYWKHI